MHQRLSLPPSNLSLAHLEVARSEAAIHLETLEDPTEARKFYDETLFPLSADWIRRTAPRGRSELLFVPVGTQIYSPILAALATRSANLVLLATEGSRACAESVTDSLIPDKEQVKIVSLGDGEDTVLMSRVVLQESAKLGSPSARATTMDVTSGLKIMAASLGAIASIKGWRQTYIRATPSPRHRQLFVQETFIELAHFRTIVGEDSRQDALSLMKAGSFAAASWSLKEAARRGVESKLDEILLASCKAFHAQSQGDFEKASSCFLNCAKLLGEGPTSQFCYEAASDPAMTPAAAPVQPSWELTEEEEELDTFQHPEGLAARFLELLAREHTL